MQNSSDTEHKKASIQVDGEQQEHAVVSALAVDRGTNRITGKRKGAHAPT
jgi:hypothetical protein